MDDAVDPKASMNIFKYLQAPDFEDCLAAIIETDADLRKRVLALGPGTSPEEFGQTMRMVHDRWSRFGVDAVLAEVAKHGRRGERVAELLAACQRLR